MNDCQVKDNAHLSPPPPHLDCYSEVCSSDGSTSQVEWFYPIPFETGDTRTIFLLLLLTLITVENELRTIGYEPTNHFQTLSSMNHVHYHAQQTGSIITNAMQPVMIPLVSVRSKSQEHRYDYLPRYSSYLPHQNAE